MSKGNRWAAQEGNQLDGIDAKDAIELALVSRSLARATDRAKQEEVVRRAAIASGVTAGPTLERLLTRSDVAQVLQCSVRTVQRLEASGRLQRCAGLVRLVRFDRNEVSRLLSGSEGATS
jgi:hypothetical protein